MRKGGREKRRQREGRKLFPPFSSFATIDSLSQPRPPATSSLLAQQKKQKLSLTRSKLQAALAPVSLSVANESHLHAGHSGNPSGAPDAETHFRVEAVSEAFEGKNPVARHRLVYNALGGELKAGLHALALKTRTPREAQAAAEAREAAK